MINNYPIYIPSKSRFDTCMTMKALDKMGMDYHVIIEEQEYKKYLNVISKDKLLILDKSYQDNYETCDNLGRTKSIGPGAARNFAWDHSISEGYDWHWVMDDNIRYFMRLNNNIRIKIETGLIFKIMEEFCLRYENVSMAGPNYVMFVPGLKEHPPFILNTRIYSCNLIRNDTPYRWRGRYNEDTDLSLRMLKDGWCTIQFNAFLQFKLTTQALKGGNTKEFYEKEGTIPKSKMLVDLHPDVTKFVWKFNRWHHEVNYKKAAKGRLVKKESSRNGRSNNHGIELIKVGQGNG